VRGRFKFSVRVMLGLATIVASSSAVAQTTFEPLPPPPPVEPLNAASSSTERSAAKPRDIPERVSRATVMGDPLDRKASVAKPFPRSPMFPRSRLTDVGASPTVAPIVAPAVATQPLGAAHSADLAPQVDLANPIPRRRVPTAIAQATTEVVEPPKALSIPASNLVGAIRLGAATGGPSLREVVPTEVSDLVFTSASDSEPANGWFTRTFRAALKRNGLLSKKPETARYELTAEVRSMAITPLAAGVHHHSVVTYRLRDLASGADVWQRTQIANLDVQRGFRFGALGGAMGAALGGALTGQNPAVTAQLITNQRGHRPFDVRIDVYEGIMRGFQEMALNSVTELAGPASRN
jgi:hypothetical protein